MQLKRTRDINRFWDKFFYNVWAHSSTLDTEIFLSTAKKANNDTAGPTKLDSTLLVFGGKPRIPIRSTNVKNYINRMAAMAAAWKEATKVIAHFSNETAFRRSVLAAADNNLKIGELVLIFPE